MMRQMQFIIIIIMENHRIYIITYCNHLLVLVAANVIPPTSPATVPPCANTLYFIILPDEILLPLVKEARPTTRAPAVARHPTIK